MMIDLAVESVRSELLKTPLDCVCKGNGIMLTEEGAVKGYCPLHIQCAFSESYRLEMLRDYYRSARMFYRQRTGFGYDHFDSKVRLLWTSECYPSNVSDMKPEDWVSYASEVISEHL